MRTCSSSRARPGACWRVSVRWHRRIDVLAETLEYSSGLEGDRLVLAVRGRGHETRCDSVVHQSGPRTPWHPDRRLQTRSDSRSESRRSPTAISSSSRAAGSWPRRWMPAASPAWRVWRHRAARSNDGSARRTTSAARSRWDRRAIPWCSSSAPALNAWHSSSNCTGRSPSRASPPCWWRRCSATPLPGRSRARCARSRPRCGKWPRPAISRGRYRP